MQINGQSVFITVATVELNYYGKQIVFCPGLFSLISGLVCYLLFVDAPDLRMDLVTLLNILRNGENNCGPGIASCGPGKQAFQGS